jgi:uncharacterized membrane protein YqjE
VEAAVAQETDRPVGELVSLAVEQMSRLVRDELRLAQAELAEKGKKAGIGAGLFGGAGLFAVFGLGCLIAAGVLGLALVVDAWLAALIMAGALLVIAGIAALAGKKDLAQATPPVPSEAIDGLRADVRTVQEGVRR